MMATSMAGPPPRGVNPTALRRGKPRSIVMKPKRFSARQGLTSPKPKATAGVIGLGIMGSAMAESLVRSGFRVVGYDILSRSRQRLRRAGGLPVSNCAAVGRESDIIITSLPSSDALIDVAMQLIGDAKGPRRSCLHRIVIETSTLP